MFEYWIDTDLTRLPAVKILNGRGFSGDNGGNKVGVIVTDSGEPITLSGAVQASIILPNGTTITVNGSKSGNRAWVVLPESAYTYRGRITVSIKLISGNDVATLGAVEAYVYPSTI